MKKLLLLSSVFCVSLYFISCSGNDAEDTLKTDASKKPDTTDLTAVNISEEAITDIIQSIPTPLEISSLIKEAGANYDANILSSSSNVSRYNSNYDVAFNIGVYSADLGYINIYEKTYSAMDYLSSIKKLAEQIKVGQYFDFETLKRLASNNKNYDSLLFISTDNFNKMDKHLRDQKRGELSVLMITGAWLEGMHIATQVCKVKETTDLTERIGYEKMNLDNLLLITQAYGQNKYFSDLHAELNKIKEIYSNVNISKEYKEPETKEVNGQLVIIDNSKSSVTISEETIKSITTQIEKTRAKLTHS